MVFAVVQSLNHTIDVLFTHDVPKELPITAIFRSQGLDLICDDWQANRSREKVSSVFCAAQPKRLYHGHYHIHYKTKHQFPNETECLVEGLDANVGFLYQDSWTILDTELDL